MGNEGRRQAPALDESAREGGPGDEGGGGGAEEAEEEREIRELEAEVKGMAERIRHLRRTVPGRLAEALSSQLAAQRPRLPVAVDGDEPDRASQVGIAGPEDEGTSEKPGTSTPEADQQMCERLDVFRAKLSGNIDAMRNVLKRINGCIARIKRADQNGIVIHPVFRKRRKI